MYYVYILSSRSRTLYAGVTNNITRRIAQHRFGHGGFTSKYRIGRLVYLEPFGNPLAAIEREKQIKGWVRAKKVALIEQENPGWKDLAEGWFAKPKGKRNADSSSPSPSASRRGQPRSSE
jgi:putative endonuclease